MKRILTILAALAACVAVRAQQQDNPAARYDVLEQLSDYVTVNQSDEVAAALAAHVERNEKRTAAGITDQTFRIRIYFDSGQNARGESEAVAARFRNLHPGVPVSRTYTNPFFKVTVGNYASKADAQNALKTIAQEFPTAFIVRN
ncbi:MAG: SPOR domain-containing protein [Bacteroidales bacterium]|nr:SPOR domain-containing protein [Bacteroidales bacterium]